LKTDNVRKQLKKSQIILKILSCIENANINIQFSIKRKSLSFFNNF